MAVGWKRFVLFGAWTFLLSIAFIYISQSFISILDLIPSFLVLLAIIMAGVVSDTIGVATTAGREAPLHAMAADRVPGARQAVWLVRHADRVATFTNDVIGDIAGTVSGAIAAGIVFRVILLQPDLPEALLTTLMVALVAALTVGGKAYGKFLAVRRSNEIVLVVGKVLYRLERISGRRLVPTGNNRQANKETVRTGSRHGQKDAGKPRDKQGRKGTRANPHRR